jgi:hypothetical protein
LKRLRSLAAIAVGVALTCLMLCSSGCNSASSPRPPANSSATPPTPAAAITVTATASAPVLALARRNGLTIEGPGRSREDTLATFDSRALASRAGTPDRSGVTDGEFEASKRAGYDLRSHLGQRARISTFPLGGPGQDHGRPFLVVVEQNRRLIGAWVSIPDLMTGIRALAHGR